MREKKTNHIRNKNGRKEGTLEQNPPGTASNIKYAYEIRLKNHLDQRWADWFDGWTITNIGDEEVILTCYATDHAGLHGVLDKIRDLNLTLISVKKITSDPL